MVIFLWSCVAVLSLVLLQGWIAKATSWLLSLCSKAAENPNTLSDDLYKDMSYDQLYHEYRKVQVEKQRIDLQKNEEAYTEEECTKYIDKYLQILERNEKNILQHLLEQAEAHIDRIQEIEEEADIMPSE